MASCTRPWSIVLGVVFCLAALQPMPAQKTGLTLAQVEHLIKAQAPDDLIASQIRSRGLNFQATSKTLDSLVAQSAGKLTLAAVRDQIRVGKIDIHTEPGAQILADGKEGLTTNADGFLQLSDLPEGNHSLIARKDGYREARKSLFLARNEERQLTLPLEWLGGYLTISLQPADAEIAVTGPQSLSGNVVNAKCSAGEYAITVSAQGYVTQTRTVQILAGKHDVENFQLAADPAILAQKLADARNKLDAGDAASAITLAEAALKLGSTDPKVQVILAEAAFQQGDFNRFVDAGTKAIRSGQTVTVAVMHFHNFPRRKIHRVTLTISTSGIALASEPPFNGCKIPAALGFDLITEVNVQRDLGGFIELHISYFSQPHSTGVLRELDFVPEGSTIGTVPSPATPGTIVIFGGGNTSVQSPGDPEQTLQGIARLIASAK
jgi:hypothetical protein